MSWRSHSRTRVQPSAPAAFAVCDRCAFTYNHDRLQWQYEYAGPRLQNQRILVCDICLDIPQELNRPLRIPADPVPIRDPRSDLYAPLMPYILTDPTGQEITDGTYSTTVIGNVPAAGPSVVAAGSGGYTMADSSGNAMAVSGSAVASVGIPGIFQGSSLGQNVLGGETYPAMGPGDPYNSTNVPGSGGSNMVPSTPPTEAWPGRVRWGLLDDGANPMIDGRGAIIYSVPD
jgi:hypothetical protein